jgi:hypothetical protein
VTFGQLGSVLADVASGGLEQRRLVALGEPAGETLQVRHVLPRARDLVFTYRP